MIIQQATKFKLIPNKKQKILLDKTFGCVRLAWNICVELFNNQYLKKDPFFVPNKSLISVKELKSLYSFIGDVSYVAIEQKLQDFNQYKNQFFNKNRKISIGRCSFKKKGINESFRLSTNGFSIKNGDLYLGKKIGKVKLRSNYILSNLTDITSITVSKSPVGNYYVSITHKKNINHLPKTNKSIGIDLGLIDFISDNQGNKVSNPKHLQQMSNKLSHFQRIFSNKKLKSNRRNKLRIKIAKIHEKIKNQRSNFLHNLSIDLVRKNDIICIENLAISNMLKNHKLAKSIQSASWSKFITYLNYKCNWYGKTLKQINRYFASSKTCSNCGHKKEEMSLDIRIWTCENCNSVHDRDINAAQNILKEGLKI